MHFYRYADFADRAIYGDAERFFADLAAVFRQEIADLVGAGCRYVQLDEVAIALMGDPDVRARLLRFFRPIWIWCVRKTPIPRTISLERGFA